jgi:hypothetical protein
VEVNAGSNPNDIAEIPLTITGDTILIGPSTNNGSFELETGKHTTWNTVNSWSQWTDVSAVMGDSGTDTGGTATHGTRVAFLQGNNAAYNMTTRVAQAGDVYTFSWDHVNRNSSHTVSMVYDDGGVITSIFDTEITSATAGTTKGMTYEIPGGSPAIGKTIGLGIINNNSNYPEVDNFILTIAGQIQTGNFAIILIGRTASGDVFITFTPGGAGYLLYSSTNLVDFEEEVFAEYDEEDTFFIPAEFVAPGKQFFRVEKQ